MTRKKRVEFTFDPLLHIYRINGVIAPAVSDVLRVLGLGWLGHPGPAAQLGTVVHEATALIESNGNSSGLDWSKLHPQVKPYIEAYYRFLAEQPWRTREIEFRTVAVQNGMPYGMTADRIGTWMGRGAVLDIKTGKSKALRDGVQTAAYSLGVWRTDGEAKIAARLIVHLKDDGSYTVEKKADFADFSSFEMGLAVTHYRLRNGLYGSELERYQGL